MLETTKRFEFGENWSDFIRIVDDVKVKRAEESLQVMLRSKDLLSKRFLDVGCGSGLFSLAARRLGATVISFDYDWKSVVAARELRRRFLFSESDWRIEQGSILDSEYVASLGQFDIVYSWGVLHHTGNLCAAIENVAVPVAPGGRLFISLYNDQGWISAYWTTVKRFYNTHRIGRVIMIALHSPYLIGVRLVFRLLTGRFRLERGMSFWHDMKDWLGGYPFEVSRPEIVVGLLENAGFKLINARFVGRKCGCNEFVFEKRG